MNKIFAKVAFEMLGTSSQPTPHRKDFTKFIAKYMQVCEEKRSAAKFRQTLTDFFNQNPEPISFQIYQDSYEDYHIIKNFIPPNDVFADIIDGCNFHYELAAEAKNLPDQRIIVGPDNIDAIIDSFFSQEDNEIYDMVENFEKNSIEEIIPHSSKAPHKNKI